MNTTCDSTFDAQQVATLYRLGKLVRASLDLDATLAAIMDAAGELTPGQLTAIMLLDGDELVIRVARGVLGNAVGQRIQASQGIAGRALRERHTVRVGDMRCEPARARPDLDDSTATRSYIAAPLIWRGQSLGVLTVGASTPGALSECHSVLVEELAEHAAGAVAHAYAFAEEQRLRAESQANAEQLEIAQQGLARGEKLAAIGQLAQGVAHEMNTPLGVIVSNLSVLAGYADALGRVAMCAGETIEQLRAGKAMAPLVAALEASLSAADVDYVLADLAPLVDDTTTSAQRIATIVRSIAMFARRDVDEVAMVDVREVLEAAITLAWSSLKYRAEIVRAFTPVAPVLGHASELTQLFVHLLLNAAQAIGHQSGIVTVATASTSDGLAVTISDTGCGIPSEHLTRVFDPFFTTRPVGQGTGMGLAVSHGIVTRHRGTIAIESVPEQGTTVTVWLPAATVSEAA